MIYISDSMDNAEDLSTKSVVIDSYRFFVANVMQKVIDRALQVHGGLGMTDDTIIAFLYRHERGARIYDGADEVHKISVARRILKSYEGKQVK